MQCQVSFMGAMMTKRGFLGACLLAMSVSAALISAAAAGEKRFAVVSLYNQTPDVTVHFSYRWGNENWRDFANFKPGQAQWFSIPLDANGRAPEFEIKINEAIGAAQSIGRTFKLNAIRREANNRDYVTVENIGPADVP
jgi:hypothetical protein